MLGQRRLLDTVRSELGLTGAAGAALKLSRHFDQRCPELLVGGVARQPPAPLRARFELLSLGGHGKSLVWD